MKQAVLVAWLCLLAWPVMAQGTFQVRFAQPAYSIAPGTSTAVSVLIDPVPEPGLFSFGLKMAFDEAMARVESAASISIPPPLDFNGVLGPGAIKSVGSGFATAKGTVNFFVTPVPYAESLLATFVLSDQSGAVGQSYSITLDIHRTLGPAESVFVTGAGGVLDLQLGFGSALVTVVPEPGSWLLIFAGGCVFLVRSAFREPGKTTEVAAPQWSP